MNARSRAPADPPPPAVAPPPSVPASLLPHPFETPAERLAPRIRGANQRYGGNRDVATFLIVERHPLTKGLSGGRAYILGGEDALGAVSRRIARDTRCAVVSLVVERHEPVAGAAGTLWHCRVTLRGSVGPGRPKGGVIEAELGVVVRDHRMPPAAR